MKRITGKKPNAEKKEFKINIKLLILVFLVVIIVAFVAIRLLPTIRIIDVDIKSASDKITKEDVLLLSGLKKGDKLYKEKRSDIEQRIEETTPKGVPTEVLRTLIGYYVANRQEDTDWVVLPVINFDAYFGNNFSHRWLNALPEDVIVRQRDGGRGVCRYMVNGMDWSDVAIVNEHG